MPRCMKILRSFAAHVVFDLALSHTRVSRWTAHEPGDDAGRVKRELRFDQKEDIATRRLRCTLFSLFISKRQKSQCGTRSHVCGNDFIRVYVRRIHSIKIILDATTNSTVYICLFSFLFNHMHRYESALIHTLSKWNADIGYSFARRFWFRMQSCDRNEREDRERKIE